MSINACAELVHRGDKDRFLATMSGNIAARAALFPLYAFNLELARAANASNEPMINAIRLQFWRDILADIYAGKTPDSHEVTRPLAEMIHRLTLPQTRFEQMINAWYDDLNSPLTPEDFTGYTSGNLMVLAGRALGAKKSADTGLYALGHSTGLANWLMALPDLAPDMAPEEIQNLARLGRDLLKTAKNTPALRDKQLAPALRCAWRTGPIFKRALQNPDIALRGCLGGSEFGRRARLFSKVLRQSW